MDGGARLVVAAILVLYVGLKEEIKRVDELALIVLIYLSIDQWPLAEMSLLG